MAAQGTSTREIKDPVLARDIIDVYSRVVAYFLATGNEEAAAVWADIVFSLRDVQGQD